MPADAICQAASDPAMPPPMMWMGFIGLEILICLRYIWVMADEPNNLVLEHLRRLRDGQDRIFDKLRQLEDRMFGLEMSVVSFKKDVAFLYETDSRL